MCRGPSCNALQGGRCRSRAFSTWGAAANAPCAVRAAVGSCPTATSRRVPMRSVRRACRWSGTGCCGSTSRAKPTCCAGRSGSCISDDRRALGEFYRILRPGGWGILLSPVDRSRAATFEDDSITDPEERTRIFGQYDHRRIYGRDYGGRLREAGFEVREIDYAARFSAEERRRYALPDDWIYVVRRPL